FGPNSDQRKARLGVLLWQSDSLGVSVSSIEGDLPAHVTPIRSANIAPAALSNLDRLTFAEVEALFDDRAMLKYQKEPGPIVFIGNLQGRNEVAISISHLLGALEQSPPGDPKGLQSRPREQSRGINPAPVTERVQPDLVYTHGTLPGSGGSPLFDAETGD